MWDPTYISLSLHIPISHTGIQRRMHPTLSPPLAHPLSFLTATNLPAVFVRHSLGRDSLSAPFPISPSLQQVPSGKQGTLSSPWHLPSLGLWENLLHSQVKWEGPCMPCGKQHRLQCLTEETDWQRSGGCSTLFHSPFLSLFFTPQLLAADLHADEGGRK